MNYQRERKILIASSLCGAAGFSAAWYFGAVSGPYATFAVVAMIACAQIAAWMNPKWPVGKV